jgi:hypothetical protein
VSRHTRHRPFYLRLRVLLPLLVLQLGALAATVWFDNVANRGITYTPDPQPIPWTNVPQVGVNLYNIQFEPNRDDVRQTLELARDMGARFARIQMPWEDVEIHAKGDFEDRRNPQQTRNAWEKYDIIVEEARRAEIELIVRIDRTPAWAQPQARAQPAWAAGVERFGGLLTGPPDNYADFADFVGAFAARYRGQVRFIQVWNEPNLAYEWNGRQPDPVQFVDLLRATYTAAKAANPDAVILFPSLAPTDGRDPTAPMTELEYLDQVYAAGGGQYFDIMSAQAYGLGQPPDEHRYVFLRGRDNWDWRRPIDTRIDVSRLVLLREVMERNGDTGKAVWISEFGYNSAPEGIPDRTRWGAPVSEEQKGEYIVGQLERARDEWPWVGVMNVWFLRWGGYRDADSNDPTPYFAVVQRNYTPLPAYDALKAYSEQGAVAGVGAHVWSHPAVRPRDAGAWELRFSGSALALSGSGQVRVAINGSAPINVTLQGNTAVPIVRGLPDDTHTAVIEGTTAPDTFIISRESPLPWLWPLVMGMLLVGLAVVGGLVGRSFVRG